MARRQRHCQQCPEVAKILPKTQFCVILASFLCVSAQKSIRSLSEFGVFVLYYTSSSLVVTVIRRPSRLVIWIQILDQLAPFRRRWHAPPPLWRPTWHHYPNSKTCLTMWSTIRGSSSSSSPTNLTTFDPAHLHGLTHQPPSHTPPRRPTVRPIPRSKQVPSHLRRTQTSSSRWESMLCFPTEYSRLDNLDNELVETESHRKRYHFGSSRTSLVCFCHIYLISLFPPRR
jgi:hypothetical protein